MISKEKVYDDHTQDLIASLTSIDREIEGIETTLKELRKDIERTIKRIEYLDKTVHSLEIENYITKEIEG